MNQSSYDNYVVTMTDKGSLSNELKSKLSVRQLYF